MLKTIQKIIWGENNRDFKRSSVCDLGTSSGENAGCKSYTLAHLNLNYEDFLVDQPFCCVKKKAFFYILEDCQQIPWKEQILGRRRRNMWIETDEWGIFGYTENTC